MTVWIIVGSVILLMAVLLFLPVSVIVDYQKSAFVQIRYLFFRYTVAPRPEKKKKAPSSEQKAQAGKQAKEKSKFRQLLEREGLGGFLDLLRETCKIAGGTVKRLLPHLTVGQFSVSVRVGGEDAGWAALNYGGVCAAVYPAVSFLVGAVRCRKVEVEVVPDLNGGESSAECHLRARIKLFFAILLLFYAGYRTFKSAVRRKKEAWTPERKAESG